MKPNRITVKFLLTPETRASLDLDALIPLFHRFIQQQSVEGLLIDVADYIHVPDGPGVILIGHDVDYGMDLTGGLPGLLVTAKRNETEDLAALIRVTLRRALVAMQAIEEADEVEVRFDRSSLVVRVLDRLVASNSEPGFAELTSTAEPIFTELFGASSVGLAAVQEDDARQAVALEVKAEAPLDSGSAIEALGGRQSAVVPGAAPQSEWDITVEELKRLRDEGEPVTIIDVREPDEYEVCNLGGTLIPVGELPDRLDELDKNARTVVHCKLGGRGAAAAKVLRGAGFENAWNLRGGILEWIERIDPSLPRY